MFQQKHVDITRSQIEIAVWFGYVSIWGHSFCDAARAIEKVHSMDQSLPQKMLNRMFQPFKDKSTSGEDYQYHI